MKRLTWLITCLIALAAMGLGTGYALVGIWSGVILTLILGAAWIITLRLDVDWISSLGFALVLILGVTGIWLGLNPFWPVLSALAALGAWDVDAFHRRQKLVFERAHALQMERIHLRRLVIALLFGFILAAFALLVQARFSFALAVTLGLSALFGLSRLIAHLRGEGN